MVASRSATSLTSTEMRSGVHFGEKNQWSNHWCQQQYSVALPSVMCLLVRGILLKNTKPKIVKGVEKSSALLDPGWWPHPETTSRQMLWILPPIYFQFMGDYWLRYIRPDYTGHGARGIDDLPNVCRGTSTLIHGRVGLPWRECNCQFA